MFTNYKYVVTPTKVIALSTYGGRTVRGVAKCHPGDTFNEDVGKAQALAAARCNEKIATKRYARARQKYNEMVQELHQMEAKAHKVADYLHDSHEAYKEAKEIVSEVRSGIES